MCTTAEQAVSALEAIGDFLDEPGNMPQIDAALVLRQIKGLRLPFERLVRNVWQEGPEVAYDRTKATLQRTLQREVTRRKALAAAKANGTAAPPPASPTTTLAGDEFLLVPPHAKPQSLAMSSTSYGIRAGLLTFEGESAAVKRRGRRHA